MKNERDLNYWIDLWEKQEKGRRNEQEFWDSRADFFNRKVFTDKKVGSNIVDRLKSKNRLTKDMKVLDIGCGPGKHTLPMAQEVGRVTALDISEKMLDYLEQNMKSTNIMNIDPINLDWKDADLKQLNWLKRFDLVFASMTPGVFNYDTLKKILVAAKRYCFLSGFVRRNDLLGDRISGYIYGKDQFPAKTYDKVYYIFNILWNLGYTPEVEYVHRKWEDKMTTEEAYGLYADKLSSYKTLSEKDRKKIKEILSKESKQGQIVEKTEVIQGLLTWEV